MLANADLTRLARSDIRRRRPRGRQTDGVVVAGEERRQLAEGAAACRVGVDAVRAGAGLVEPDDLLGQHGEEKEAAAVGQAGVAFQDVGALAEGFFGEGEDLVEGEVEGGALAASVVVLGGLFRRRLGRVGGFEGWRIGGRGGLRVGGVEDFFDGGEVLEEGEVVVALRCVEIVGFADGEALVRGRGQLRGSEHRAGGRQ